MSRALSPEGRACKFGITGNQSVWSILQTLPFNAFVARIFATLQSTPPQLQSRRLAWHALIDTHVDQPFAAQPAAGLIALQLRSDRDLAFLAQSVPLRQRIVPFPSDFVLEIPRSAILRKLLSLLHDLLLVILHLFGIAIAFQNLSLRCLLLLALSAIVVGAVLFAFVAEDQLEVVDDAVT